MADAHWTTSKWTHADLEFKTVEFTIPAKGGTLSGTGKFYVSRNPEGLLRIELVTEEAGRHWAERVQTRYQLPQIAVDRIQRHPNPAIADFRLI
jgi:hypothetical protein